MRIVVFGGAGFLGSHVVDALVLSGHEVTIFDVNDKGYINSNSKMIIGNILEPEAVKNVLQNVDYVYDFAGIANLDDASTRPVDTALYNIVGTCNILDACVCNGVKRFIYASSFYANSNKGGFYRCSKQAAEIYIKEYYKKFGQEYTILRYGSLYGTRAGLSNGIYRMLESAYREGKVYYRGNGSEVREYIHVEDAARLSVQILEDQFRNMNVQLTGQESYSIKEISQIISEILDKDIEELYDDSPTELHYLVTPYNYKPEKNYKLVSNIYHDLGQGLVECLSEIVERNK